MLEALALPYRAETIDLRRGEQKSAGYLAINPMGKVPALRDHDAIVTETSAIRLYLADRYGYGSFGPEIDDPRRGTYLRWAVFATSVLGPAINAPRDAADAEAHAAGWGGSTRPSQAWRPR